MNNRIAVLIAALLLLAFPALALTVQTDAPEYNPGDSVEISGTADPNEAVAVQVVDPQGDTIILETPVADSAGDWSLLFTLPDTAELGTYDVTATTATEQDTASFGVVEAPTPTFDLALSPSSISLDEADTGTVTAMVDPVAGFSETVTLSASGNPAGSTVAISPESDVPQFDSVVTIDTGTADPGTYTITITGEDGGFTKTATLSLTIAGPPPPPAPPPPPPGPSFTVSISPTNLSLQPGASDTIAVDVASVEGFDQNVTLSAVSVPNGSTLTFSPETAPVNFSSSATVDAGNASEGNYTVRIVATGDDIIKTADLSLMISVPQACPAIPQPTAYSTCTEQADGSGLQNRTVFECGPETSFAVVSSVETRACCPACPPDEAFGDCVAGQQSRTVYTCSPDTGHMCVSQTETQACVTADDAQAAISAAQSTIADAAAENRNVTQAQSLLSQAQQAFNTGNNDQAKSLADQATTSALTAPVIAFPSPVIPIALIVVIAIAGVLLFILYRAKKIPWPPGKPKPPSVCYIGREESVLGLTCSVCRRPVCLRHAASVRDRIYCYYHVPRPGAPPRPPAAPPPPGAPPQPPAQQPPGYPPGYPPRPPQQRRR